MCIYVDPPPSPSTSVIIVRAFTRAANGAGRRSPASALLPFPVPAHTPLASAHLPLAVPALVSESWARRGRVLATDCLAVLAPRRRKIIIIILRLIIVLDPVVVSVVVVDRRRRCRPRRRCRSRPSSSSSSVVVVHRRRPSSSSTLVVVVRRRRRRRRRRRSRATLLPRVRLSAHSALSLARPQHPTTRTRRAPTSLATARASATASSMARPKARWAPQRLCTSNRSLHDVVTDTRAAGC